MLFQSQGSKMGAKKKIKFIRNFIKTSVKNIGKK